MRLIPLALLTLATPAAAAPPAKITYAEHVLPILKDKCLGCHNQDKMSSGLNLSTYAKVMAGSSSGDVVVPGDLDKSALYQTVTHQQQPYMPPKSPMMPKESLDVIKRWIEGGAPETAGSKTEVAAKPKANISLKSVVRGRPAGPPPMPPATLSLEPVVKTARANAVTALAASPWAPLVAIGGQRQILLYNADTLDPVGVLSFPEGAVTVLAFSRNGGFLLAGGGRGGKSGRVVVWDVRTAQRVIEVGDEYDAVLAADISADQSVIALGGSGKMLRLYSTKDGSLVSEVKKHTDWITSIEFSPDGVLLATGDRNGGLYVWEGYTGREYFALRGHTGGITGLSWRADSNVLLSSSEDGTARLWEMENGGQIKSWGAHGGGTRSGFYARDGRIVTTGRDRLAKLWDGNGGQLRAFDAFGDLALRGVLSHDGARVIAGDLTGEVRVWSAADGKLLGTLQANPPGVAERLAAAEKDLAQRQAAAAQAAAAAAAALAAAQKAATDLAAAEKAVTDTATAARQAADGLAKAKANAQQAAAAAATAQATLQTKKAAQQAAVTAAAQAKAAAEKARENKALATAAQTAQAAVAKAADDVTAAEKAIQAALAGRKTADDQATAAQKLAADTAAAAAAAPQRVQALRPTIKPTADKAAADRAAADRLAAEVKPVQDRVARLKQVLPVAGR